jgi:hypothetical protein
MPNNTSLKFVPVSYFQLENYDTYLMYKPSGTDSIWVPIETVSWGFTAYVKVETGGLFGNYVLDANKNYIWDLNAQDSENPKITHGPSPAVTEPTWTHVFQENWIPDR